MTETKTATNVRFQRDWLVLVCVDIGAPLAAIWSYHAGEASRSIAVLSAGVVLIAGNLFVLLATHRRSRREGLPLRRSHFAGALFLAIAAFLLTVFGISEVKHRNEYLDLASSDVPLSSISPEKKRLVVELIRRTAANSQEENKALAEASKAPTIPALYSPESFANQQVMQSTLEHMTNAAEIDFTYFSKQQAAKKDFRRKMALCDPEYLKAWDSDARKKDDLENATNQLEHNWLASVRALYDYAAQNSTAITVQDGQVSISKDTVRRKFGDLFDRSHALHQELLTAVHQEAETQAKAKSDLAN